MDYPRSEVLGPQQKLGIRVDLRTYISIVIDLKKLRIDCIHPNNLRFENRVI